MRRLLSAFLLSLLAPMAVAADALPPDQLVRTVTENLQAQISERHSELKADPAQLEALIDELVVPHFDVPRISRLVLGPHGRGASPEQVQRFGAAFKNMLFRTYANALLEYHDSVRVEWRPLRLAADAQRATVQSNLIRKDGPPVPVGFVMQKSDAGWKVFDLTVENISLINNFRAQLNAEITRNGLDAVIQRLEGGELTPETSIGNG